MGTALKLDNSAGNVNRADVVFAGDKITIPEGMKPSVAAQIMMEFEKAQDQKVSLAETYNAFPWDGAIALAEVLKKRFGWVKLDGHMGFFGRKSPQLIQVEVAPDKFEPCIWGEFTIPNADDAVLSCSVNHNEGRLCFSVNATLKRKDEVYIRELLREVRDYLKVNSIYRGKAIRLKVFDSDGDRLSIPEIKFIDTSKVNRDALILSKDVHDAVNTNLFTPIERIKELASNNLPIKRGVLLGGIYGTGKTMTAEVATKLAVDNGVTYIYVTRANELVEALRFAEMYQSPGSVVFCEDIDREMAGQERTAEMDDILNIIDGVDTKRSNVIVVLTTNAMEKINKAMLRPGRLDAVIEVTPPDPEAVERLVRHYGGALIAADVDLVEVGQALNGCIPAVIAEVVKRAKLTQLRLQPVGEAVAKLSTAALLESAKTMKRQLQLMQDPIPEEPMGVDSAIAKLIKEHSAEASSHALETAALSAVMAREDSIAMKVARLVKS